MSKSSATVLAVDDNATIRKAISMRLRSKGYEVVTAPNGKEALDLVASRSFDLVLLDLQMPGMRGDEVLERIRMRYDQTQLPVIMLAASGDKHDIARTLKLGANDYVTKPGELPILLARIKTQLSLKHTAAKLREAEFSASCTNRNIQDLEATIDQFSRDRVHEEAVGKFDSTDEFRYHVIYDNTPMTCFTLNSEGEILFANRFGLQFLGFQRDEVTGLSVFELYAPDDRAIAAEHLASVTNSEGRLHRWDIRRQKKNGNIFWVRETARAIGRGQDSMILMTCEDIDDTYSLTAKLSYQATHDELTGLSNRKSLEERLTAVLESAHSEHTEHSLAIIDMDQFKIINDTCGHTAGDELLRQVARLLKSIVRKRDTLARLGADEFALLIEDCSMAQAYTGVEALRQSIDSFKFVWEERVYKISASVGLVSVNDQCEDSNSALSMAGTACFAAKDSGRNRIHSYQKDDLAVTRRHGEMRWATRINDALFDDRFELNFQRITSINSDLNCGDHYELLIRMRDELGNIVMPSEFLPAAERYNLSEKVDRWVIGHALDWLRDHPVLVEQLHLCGINLSGQSMGNEGILRFILNQIDEGSIPAEKLCFEVTETAAISDLAQATNFITLLKDRGCMFALDDFGSGFSSFSYLKKLPVDFLKIDGSFVRDICTNSIDLAMVRSINDIGHVMGKKTIAEFVEDRGVLDVLRDIGVDYAQGYEIGRPTPITQFFSIV
ncbi:MAG: diguanylate cyclase (GGDEF)-like protein/PAS domain S-box-containing protein [Gammaproteobacteria bacterium]